MWNPVVLAPAPITPTLTAAIGVGGSHRNVNEAAGGTYPNGTVNEAAGGTWVRTAERYMYTYRGTVNEAGEIEIGKFM